MVTGMYLEIDACDKLLPANDSRKVGDAVASYLDKPDLLTSGQCLYGRTNVEAMQDDRVFRRAGSKRGCMVYPAKARPSWFSAASSLHWCVTVSYTAAALALAGALLYQGIIGYLEQVSISGNPFPVSFGSVNTDMLVDTLSYNDLIGDILLANTPQLIISMLYLFYNSLITSMSLASVSTKQDREVPNTLLMNFAGMVYLCGEKARSSSI